MQQLFLFTVLIAVLTGCGFPADRAVHAYDTCIARHPQEVVVCEGPRESYQVDTPTLQAMGPDKRVPPRLITY